MIYTHCNTILIANISLVQTFIFIFLQKSSSWFTFSNIIIFVKPLSKLTSWTQVLRRDPSYLTLFKKKMKAKCTSYVRLQNVQFVSAGFTTYMTSNPYLTFKRAGLWFSLNADYGITIYKPSSYMSCSIQNLHDDYRNRIYM